ncbi:MAG TPA: GNAT family N-acetyltransferase [Streptosporangiaceae bacterium]|jgi:ribosomal protein S18 acetylase RimI-like enzyme
MIEHAREQDRAEIMRNFERFWAGDRDLDFLRSVHHPMFFIEFADTAFVARSEDTGEILGYLLGFVAPGGYGYVHFIAVRDDARKLGLASTLYEAFTAAAVAGGATSLKAITSPQNQASQAFHRRVGFTSMTRVDDYGGTGRPRIIMRKPGPLEQAP